MKCFWAALVRTFLVLGILFTVGVKLRGESVNQYVPAYIGLFILSVFVRSISAQFTLNRYLEWAFYQVSAFEQETSGNLEKYLKIKHRDFRNTGACLSPVNAYLNLIGIEALGLRMERECQNALELAHWIVENYSDIIVNYPGLESSSWHHVAKEQFEHGYGAILTLRVGSKEKAFKFIDSLTIPYIISNIGDTKTLKNQRLIRNKVQEENENGRKG